MPFGLGLQPLMPLMPIGADNDSQIVRVDCLLKVDFLGNGQLDPPETL